MAEEKVDFDEEEDLNDGYKYIEKGSDLLPSSQQADKQAGTNDYQVAGLITVKRNNKHIDMIQKCIGQITISYEGDDRYRYGTGTVYKHLDGKYYLVITCAHNLVYYDDETNGKEKAKQIFFLPNGIQDENTRLKCVEWIAHEQYDPNIPHSEHDIGIILCYDARKVYKKEILPYIIMNDVISIGQCKKAVLKGCSIYGYPVKGK
eukprot:382621_1